jgi:ketosteroid isomerase-like protein
LDLGRRTQFLPNGLKAAFPTETLASSDTGRDTAQAMSQENIERLRAVYTEWAKGNFRAGRELWATDVSFEQMSDGRAALGAEAIEGYMREFLAQWSDFRIEAEDIAEVGDTILVTERQLGTGKSSGIETDQTAYAIWTFRNGLVVRARWMMDRTSALEAAELRE